MYWINYKERKQWKERDERQSGPITTKLPKELSTLKLRQIHIVTLTITTLTHHDNTSTWFWKASLSDELTMIGPGSDKNICRNYN